jgi:hypothetical protein
MARVQVPGYLTLLEHVVRRQGNDNSLSALVPLFENSTGLYHPQRCLLYVRRVIRQALRAVGHPQMDWRQVAKSRHCRVGTSTLVWLVRAVSDLCFLRGITQWSTYGTKYTSRFLRRTHFGNTWVRFPALLDLPKRAQRRSSRVGTINMQSCGYIITM